MSLLGDLQPRKDEKPSAPARAGRWGPSAEGHAELRNAHHEALSDRAVMEALAGAHPATLPILLALVLLCASAAVVPLLEVVPAAAAIGVVVASFVSAYVVALRWRKRRAARELARLRALPIPLDLPQYVDVLAGGHPEQGRVRVIVWFEAPPRAAVRDRLETRAREHGVPEIEWASNDEEIRLTSEFFGLRSHSDDGWDPKNAPIHKQTRRVLDHVLLPLRTEAPLRAVQVRIV